MQPWHLTLIAIGFPLIALVCNLLLLLRDWIQTRIRGYTDRWHTGDDISVLIPIAVIPGIVLFVASMIWYACVDQAPSEYQQVLATQTEDYDETIHWSTESTINGAWLVWKDKSGEVHFSIYLRDAQKVIEIE